MPNHDPAENATGGFLSTLLVDPSNPAHATLLAQMPGWRGVSVHDAIGRDLVESPWVCVADWRLFAQVDHLRELLWQRRGATIVLVGLSSEEVGKEGVRAMRRFAGEVIGLLAAADPEWTTHLVVPVTSVGPEGLIPAIQEASRRQPADLGSIDVHLREAINYIERGDHSGAFSSAARALAMEPDQPGIIADVARLLGRMGRSGDGEKLCKVFLLQRPESDAVKQALDDLQPVVS